MKCKHRKGSSERVYFGINTMARHQVCDACGEVVRRTEIKPGEVTKSDLKKMIKLAPVKKKGGE